MRIIVTGAAGFIGFNLTKKLTELGHDVLAIDNLRPSYGGDMALMRSKVLSNSYGVQLQEIDLVQVQLTDLNKLMGDADVVIHLAAWPGVRTSALYPHAYAENNISVFNKIIESVRILRTSRFLYASSSSVYGNLGVSQPVKEIQADGKELLSFYSATKWINERVAAQYKLNQDVDSTALRFFTVYGPYGRPDMAYWDFTRKLLANETINLHGEKGGKRCFTYIDDALEILLRLINLDCKLHQVPAINISNGQPHTAFELMDNLAIALDVRDPKFLEVQRPKDDVIGTWADTTKLEELVGATPRTSLSQGTENFVKWYMRNGKPS